MGGHVDIKDQVASVGRFLQWTQSVSVDQARKLLKVLPEYQDAEALDIDDAATPDDEHLRIRIDSY